MQSTPIQKHRAGRLRRTLCDVGGVLLGLLFLVAGLFLLDGTIDYMRYGGSGGRHINSAIGCALGTVALLFLSVCLALPTSVYKNRTIRIAGHLAASMTSAVTAASVVFPVFALLHLWVAEPPSPGSAAADIGGIVVLFIMLIGLAAFLVFLPSTFILAGKSRPRLMHPAIGTLVAGVVGGLLIYLCH